MTLPENRRGSNENLEEALAALVARDQLHKLALLVLSTLAIVALAWAALAENLLPGWRSYQQQYGEILQDKATDDLGRQLADDFHVEVRQVVLPELATIDRCVSCHVGLEDPRMAEAPQPFTSHPGDFLEQHEVDEFGCVVCHDGQGRALLQDDAHGQGEHWHHPVEAKETVYTNCSRCHQEADLFASDSDLYVVSTEPRPIFQDELDGAVPGFEAAEARKLLRGKDLVKSLGCLGCHRYHGRGGLLGPDLSYTGDKLSLDFDFSHVQGEHTVAHWLQEHFLDPQAVSPGTLMPDMDLSESQARALTLYLLAQHEKTMPAALRPAPPAISGVVVGGERIYSLFCAACHGSDGQGSTMRQARGEAPEDTPVELMVPSLSSSDTLSVASDTYLARVIQQGRPGTAMVGWAAMEGEGLRQDEIARLVDYLRGWQPSGADPFLVDSGRGDPELGGRVFAEHCAACHGDEGRGGLAVSLRATSFLSISTDRFLAQTIVEGRPDTAMPAWRDLDRGLVQDVIAAIRTWQPTGGGEALVLRLASGPDGPRASADFGRTIYKGDCAVCHGSRGEGDLGPSLVTPEFLAVVDDRYLLDAIVKGRPDTAMPAWRHLGAPQQASLIKYLRAEQPAPSRTLPGPGGEGDIARGSQLYAGTCSGCHGERAEGGVGPQLGNPVFLASATDALIRNWVLHGRGGPPMLGFDKSAGGMVELSTRQVDDIVAYVRSLQDRPMEVLCKNPSGSATLGTTWYEGACSSCHGADGRGDTGPALANHGFLEVVSDGFIQATMSLGRDGTEMRPVKKGAQSIVALTTDQMDDIVALLRSWERSPPSLAQRYVIPWDLSLGEELWIGNCSGCHGLRGKAETHPAGQEAAWAPNLNNQGFLDAATDGFLQATIIKGRSGTAMRSFSQNSQSLSNLDSQQIDAIVAHIRSWSNQDDVPSTGLAYTAEPGT